VFGREAGEKKKEKKKFLVTKNSKNEKKLSDMSCAA
jgi:hypothetical protein